MATQVKSGLPSGEFSIIDNSASPVTITVNGTPQTTNNQTGLNSDKAILGFDTTAPGATSQGLNSFGDTGTVLLDSVNDTVYADPSCATVKGNPVSSTPPTFATVSTVLNSAATGIRILWKNPAIIFFGF